MTESGPKLTSDLILPSLDMRNSHSVSLWIIKKVEIVLRVKNLVALLTENTSPGQERDRRHGGQHVADTEADIHAKKFISEGIMLQYQILHSLLIVGACAKT